MQGMTRRAIIRNCMMLGLGCLGGKHSWSRAPDGGRRLVILHTNDTHPGISIPGSTNSYSRGDDLLISRYEIIQQIRAEGMPVLLLDSGDFSGRNSNILPNEIPPAWRVMQLIGYDAVALGDAELAAGMDMIDLHWGKVGIPLLACNYQLEGTVLEKWVRPYCIVEKGNIRIGMIGIGLPLSDRLPAWVSAGITSEDPIRKVNTCVTLLRKQGCELIICLSHLGDQSSTKNLHDFQLAQENVGIDIIIGAHSHQLYEYPRRFTNKIGEITVVNQMGWGGGYLGRLDVFFRKKALLKR